MVCHGPDPPDDSPHNLTPPARHELMSNGNHEDSDEEQSEHFGYEPLPQGPEFAPADNICLSEEDNDVDEVQVPADNVPPIESMESFITRQVWNTPRPTDSIEMNNERAQQVMSIMANFPLPQASIPEWAHSITEEQWKRTLNDQIEKLRSSR